MSILDKYELETISYGTTGWNGIHSSNIQKIEDNLHSMLLVTVGEDISAYEALYPGTSGKWWLAKASSGKFPAIGLSIEDASADETNIRVQRVGPITNSAWSLTPYQYVYLSRTQPGQITQSEPPNNCQLIGWAESATTIVLFGNTSIGNCPGSVLTITTTTTTTTAAPTTTTTTV